jgi:hypothetical protein
MNVFGDILENTGHSLEEMQGGRPRRGSRMHPIEPLTRSSTGALQGMRSPVEGENGVVD